MIPLPQGGSLSVSVSSEIGISHEALANILKTQELSMDSNQRSYAWEKENVQELFQDIQNAIAKGDPEYFLGSVVVTRSERHVVDGQQRLPLAKRISYVKGMGRKEENGFPRNLRYPHMPSPSHLCTRHHIVPQDRFFDRIVVRLRLLDR